jgi:hypothetical protein
VKSALDQELYLQIKAAAPELILWNAVALAVMTVGYLVVAGNAVLNEIEAEADRQKRWHEIRDHVQQELTGSVTRSVKASFREREEKFAEWQEKLQAAEEELSKRCDFIMARELNVAAGRRELEAARVEVIPLKRAYEDGSSTLNSLIAVAGDDHAELLKMLGKVRKWITQAVDAPEKFVADAKAERVNPGWATRLERKVEQIQIRIEGTRSGLQGVEESVINVEKSSKTPVPPD